MARPTLKVEIAFDAGITGTPTWTDVTNKVRVNPGVDAGHWRRDEGSTCDRSDCSLVLRNDDGRYTPGNASSPLSPNIKKGRRIRVTSVLNGEEFPRFTGYIDDWKAEWPATVGHISDCRISASSRMAYLGRGTELRSTMLESDTVLADVPTAYYPLSEPEKATAANDYSGNGHPQLAPAGSGTVVSFSGAGVSRVEGDTGAAFAGGQYLSVRFASAAPSYLEFAMSRSGAPSATETVAAIKRGSEGVEVAADTSGFLRLYVHGVLIGTTTVSACDGRAHHVMADGYSGDLFLDGTLAISGSSSAGPIDAVTLMVGGGVNATLQGTVGHVAVYPADDPALIAAHASVLLTGYAGESPAVRFSRYAAYVGIPAGETDFEDGQVADLAHIDITGKTALAAMRDVELTEGGVLFDALDGTLTLHDRARRYEAAAFGTLLFGGGFFGGGPDGTEFTLSYTRGHIANPIVPLLDDQQQVNDQTNTNTSGVTGRQFDQDSINDHGLYRQGLTLATTDPDEPLLRASWTVSSYAEPLTRVSEVEVNLHNLDDDLAAVVLQAQVGTIFTLADLPDNAPSEKMHLFVEGRSDVITGNEDRVIFRTSPVEVSEVFMLDHPDRGLDSGYRLAY